MLEIQLSLYHSNKSSVELQNRIHQLKCEKEPLENQVEKLCVPKELTLHLALDLYLSRSRAAKFKEQL